MIEQLKNTYTLPNDKWLKVLISSAIQVVLIGLWLGYPAGFVTFLIFLAGYLGYCGAVSAARYQLVEQKPQVVYFDKCRPIDWRGEPMTDPPPPPQHIKIDC